MMISPFVFLEEHKKDSFDTLLIVRDKLIAEIKAFEQREGSFLDDLLICPSPEVIYQMNLKYLSVLCDYISERYNEEFVNGEDDF